MLGSVVRLLRCPVCAAPLRAEPLGDEAGDERPRSLTCRSGHTFDVARQGYVSLLAGAHRHPGDTAAMVAHRLAFLDAGHYRPIAEAMAALAGEVLDRSPAPGLARTVLDIGGGPGWYAARLLDALADPATGRGGGAERTAHPADLDGVGIVLDSSVAAARRAARAHPRLAAVVADGVAGYPIGDGVVTIALSVFAPRNGPEIVRVLAPGGMLVVVTPEADHLAELRSAAGMLGVDADKSARLAAALPGLRPAGASTRVRRTLRLDHAHLRHLILMGPSAFHLTEDEATERIAVLPEPTEVTLAVRAEAYVASQSTK